MRGRWRQDPRIQVRDARLADVHPLAADDVPGHERLDVLARRAAWT